VKEMLEHVCATYNNSVNGSEQGYTVTCVCYCAICYTDMQPHAMLSGVADSPDGTQKATRRAGTHRGHLGAHLQINTPI